MTDSKPKFSTDPQVLAVAALLQQHDFEWEIDGFACACGWRQDLNAEWFEPADEHLAAVIVGWMLKEAG